MANTDETRGTARSFTRETLDKTRQNIGPLDAEEAKAMVRKLGGEVLPERDRPAPSGPLNRRQRPAAIRPSGVSAAEAAAKSASLATAGSAAGSATHAVKKEATLPLVGARELKLMNQLMMSDEYEIKPDYGFLNFLFQMSSRGKERVTRKFGGYRLRKHVEHMQSFVSTIRTIIQISPAEYRELVATETDLRFKFLRAVAKWNMPEIKKLGDDAADYAEALTVPMLIPFVKAVYHEVLIAYYLGEQPASLLIKEVFSEVTEQYGADAHKMQNLSKQAVTEWLYVYNQLAQGMYPLLMRMCSTKFVPYPQFFTQQLNQILQFVGLSKFDLLLPEKRRPLHEKKKEEEVQKKQEPADQPGNKDDVVNTGLRLLNQMFPKAGFNDLDAHPDMFPYFQPLYKFQEGFNMLSPENGLQVELVLMKILEDLFHGCRNIVFHLEEDAAADSLAAIMTDWSYYLEDMFYKSYGDYLRNFMNSSYTQSDYATTQYGKENITNLFWRAKLDFLPNLQFNAPTLTKPRSDNKYRHLSVRVSYLRRLFTSLAKRIDDNAAQKTAVMGIDNPWSRYIFDIPNVVSRRMDVLLGAKRDDATTNATNANLIKYSLCIVAVLDWWINNPDSPAYTADADHFYRMSKDGTPEFSVPVRNDQNQLFSESIKKAAAKAAK